MSATIPHRYRPASDGWFALCRVDLVLAVDLPAGDPRLDALWSGVSGAASSADLLDELTRGGISATPAFVLVDRSGRSGVRALVRGSAAVGIDGDDIDGRQSSGWAEGAGAADAPVAARLPVSGEAAELPIVHGIVRVSAIATGPVAAAAEAPAAEAPARPLPPVDTTISATTIVELTGEESPASAPAVTEKPVADGSGYDHLFGETMYRSVEDAAVRSAADESADPEDRIDERTVVASDLAAARASRRAARRTAEPATPSAPRLYVDLSTGGREPLDRPLVVGRAPSTERVSDGNIPRLVTMTTPNQDISRTHVQLAVEGGTVVVTDLHSRNGTMVQLPGKPPQQLRAGEPTPVTVGTVVDLGDGATLTVGEET